MGLPRKSDSLGESNIQNTLSLVVTHMILEFGSKGETGK
jgi:hypothetical protein